MNQATKPSGFWDSLVIVVGTMVVCGVLFTILVIGAIAVAFAAITGAEEYRKAKARRQREHLSNQVDQLVREIRGKQEPANDNSEN